MTSNNTSKGCTRREFVKSGVELASLGIISQNLIPPKERTLTTNANAPSNDSNTISMDMRARWSEKRAWDWYRHLPWLRGINFVPSTAGNDTEIWSADTFDEPTIDRELYLARSLGFNTLRIFLQYLVWKADPKGMKERMERFLLIADKHGLSTVFVLFDDCAFGNPIQGEPYPGKQRGPIPGVQNSMWTPSPGLKEVIDRSVWPDLERYVKDLLGAFGRDKRVLMWDLYNEPGNSGMGEKSLPLLEAAFTWARSVHSEHPLTAGVWNDDLHGLNELQIAQSDVISYHAYVDYATMSNLIKRYKSYGRPVICTEWMARLLGSKWETDFPLFKRQRVGCYSWGLVNGRTQTQFAWWSKPDAPEPEVWFHDLLHRDNSPYNAAEVALIRTVAEAPGVQQLIPLFGYPVRDTCICQVDGTYYLTGTTGAPTWWQTNDGIRLWRSRDMKRWEPMGLVWSFLDNVIWQKEKEGHQAIWAPEIHYIHGNFWIAYCMNYGGTGILKSVSGRPDGPYEDVHPEGPLTPEIDASLFEDDDGTVYFLYQNGKIARMKEDMSGLAETPQLLHPEDAEQVGFEGVYLFKTNGRYHLSCADFTQGEYHCYSASADNIRGPYGKRYLAIPHGGHNMFFRNMSGKWWSTFFGNDANAPFRERPGALPLEFGLDGEVRPQISKG